MKKIKTILRAGILSTILAGNVFASDFTGFGVFSFFESIVNAVASLTVGDPSCEGRNCQVCRPKEDGGNGNCRPTQN